ncbi:Bidirectional sugar transporter SWEET14 [Apostasia shenzhenica]|uniref:Bidirectional sugar transporter SWEET n=1 Tax=Apostasia shenzhenica TaxID=1088818 RepID=A0A2I0AI80_9ASPA|nr:Bidirectional sugar transporter SWEET14 [Apostasia shenzhenica]
MAGLPLHNPWALAAGILGNIASIMVFLVPISTFYRIYKKKSTEEFQSVPYVVALFSAMLWLYYAFIKTNEILLIMVNSFGVIMESMYIIIFLFYAHEKARIYAVKIITFLIVGVFSLIVLATLFLVRGHEKRVEVIGWICVAFAVSVFAAPLSIMKQVIETKSVEFLQFHLSFFLTLSAITWFLYGFLIRDKYVMLPNVLGFIFGSAQMILHVIYKKKPTDCCMNKSLETINKPEKNDDQKINSCEWAKNNDMTSPV